MLKKLITTRAQRDIRTIHSYSLDNFGAEQTVKYMQELSLRIEQLRIRPYLGRNRSEELGMDIYSYIVGSHTIYYMFDDQSITIINVLHQSRLPKKHISQSAAYKQDGTPGNE